MLPNQQHYCHLGTSKNANPTQIHLMRNSRDGAQQFVLTRFSCVSDTWATWRTTVMGIIHAISLPLNFQECILNTGLQTKYPERFYLVHTHKKIIEYLHVLGSQTLDRKLSSPSFCTETLRLWETDNEQSSHHC